MQICEALPRVFTRSLLVTRYQAVPGNADLRGSASRFQKFARQSLATWVPRHSLGTSETSEPVTPVTQIKSLLRTLRSKL
jgi:hypothetical protein